MPRTARLALGVIALAFLLAACGDDVDRDERGVIVESGEVSVFSLRVGDCFDDEGFDQEAVSSLAAVPCIEPHDNEAYALFDIASADASFPGADELLGLSDQACLQLFEDFVGVTYEDSELDFFPITPTSDSWADGDREVICSVYHFQLRKLTGTMRDSRS
jgi:hypothetical protein